MISRSNWHLFCQVLSLFTKGFQCTNISPWFPESKQLFLINVPLNFRIPGDLYASHWIEMENYCHIPCSLKHTYTCKWSGRVFWSCSRRTFLYVFTKSIQFPNVISISLLLATYQYVLTVTGATCTHCRPIFNWWVSFANLRRCDFVMFPIPCHEGFPLSADSSANGNYIGVSSQHQIPKVGESYQ